MTSSALSGSASISGFSRISAALTAPSSSTSSSATRKLVARHELDIDRPHEVAHEVADRVGLVELSHQLPPKMSARRDERRRRGQARMSPPRCPSFEPSVRRASRCRGGFAARGATQGLTQSDDLVFRMGPHRRCSSDAERPCSRDHCQQKAWVSSGRPDRRGGVIDQCNSSVCPRRGARSIADGMSPHERNDAALPEARLASSSVWPPTS